MDETRHHDLILFYIMPMASSGDCALSILSSGVTIQDCQPPPLLGACHLTNYIGSETIQQFAKHLDCFADYFPAPLLGLMTVRRARRQTLSLH